MEWGFLVLRHFLHLAIQLAGGCLIDFTSLLQMVGAHGLQHAEHTHCIGISGVFRGIEGYLYVALGSQVIDFRRLNLAHQLHQGHGV